MRFSRIPLRVISLALGRAPTFNAFQNASPGPLLDHSEDDALWTPYYGAGDDDSARDQYPPAKSYTILTFEAFSSLCEVSNPFLFHGTPCELKFCGTRLQRRV